MPCATRHQIRQLAADILRGLTLTRELDAGAVVVRDPPANVIAVGNPARVVRSL